MIEGSRRIIHFGINFMFAPAIPIDTDQQLKFQGLLDKEQIVFEQINRTDKALKFSSSKGGRIDVQVGTPGPQVSQLLLLSQNPTLPRDSFIEHAEIICRIFREVWNEPQQIIQRDSCVRSLYQVTDNHAFQYLWEKRLKQPADGLDVLKRPVLGGGLRLVIPPSEDKKTQIELKIESFLRDSKMLFVEVQYAWLQPMPINEGFNPKRLIEEIDQFNNNEVTQFIRGGVK